MVLSLCGVTSEEVDMIKYPWASLFGLVFMYCKNYFLSFQRISLHIIIVSDFNWPGFESHYVDGL